MLCRHYMVRSAVALTTVPDTVTLATALAKMTKHHTQQLLLIDEAGEFRGEISSFTLAKMLLPPESGTPQSREQAELETLGDVDERITPHLGRRVSEFAEHELPIVEPDTPLSDALRLMVPGRLRLPVVDPKTKQLVGVISPLTVLRRYQF